MSSAPRTLSDDQIARYVVTPAGAVNPRRDLFLLVRYVQDKGIVRTKRHNAIPKAAGRRLAKILSYEGEAACVEDSGQGPWAHAVSDLARQVGVIDYDTEGSYAGYSSAEPSFPDNAIEVVQDQWDEYLARSPLDRERLLLGAWLRSRPSEFFRRATLLGGTPFDSRGCAIGPASRMDLPGIRRGLLDMLATLEPDTWYDQRDLVALLRDRHPHLILDPDKRGPSAKSAQAIREWEWANRRGHGRGTAKPMPKPKVQLEDGYVNFHELAPGTRAWDRSSETQITEQTPDAFRRVEGRYLEYFLQEIPYLAGFVDLAWRQPDDQHGLDTWPWFERLVATRLTRRFFQIWKADPAFERVAVTVLPTFEVLVEAPSYPDVVLDRLRPYTRQVQEDGVIHRLKIDRKAVVAHAAAHEGAEPAAAVLVGLSGRALPENVAAELASWTRRGEAAVIYEGFGLAEMAGGGAVQKQALSALGDLAGPVIASDLVLVSNPGSAFDRLEQAGLVPSRVRHPLGALAPCGGRLAPPAPTKVTKGSAASRPPDKPATVQVDLRAEDTVCYHSTSGELLDALHQALTHHAPTCLLVDTHHLVISASALPKLRAAVARLSDRFDVTFTDPTQ